MVNPIDAQLALAEVHARRRQVVETNLVPAWFWPSLGVLLLLFVAAVDSGITWLTVVGSVLYAAGLSTLCVAMIRSARVQIRPSLMGLRGGLAIGGFTLVLVAVGIGLSFALEALGVPMSATLGCAPVAVGLAVGGPRLMAYLRRVVLDRPLATR